MEIWLDNQLSSAFPKKMQEAFNITVKSSFLLQISTLKDKEIYKAARQKGDVILITKDADFPLLLTQYGSPLKIIKLNTGNMPTNLLWNKYKENLRVAIHLLEATDTEIIFIEY